MAIMSSMNKMFLKLHCLIISTHKHSTISTMLVVKDLKDLYEDEGGGTKPFFSYYRVITASAAFPSYLWIRLRSRAQISET